MSIGAGGRPVNTYHKRNELVAILSSLSTSSDIVSGEALVTEICRYTCRRPVKGVNINRDCLYVHTDAQNCQDPDRSVGSWILSPVKLTSIVESRYHTRFARNSANLPNHGVGRTAISSASVNPAVCWRYLDTLCDVCDFSDIEHPSEKDGIVVFLRQSLATSPSRVRSTIVHWKRTSLQTIALSPKDGVEAQDKLKPVQVIV